MKVRVALLWLNFLEKGPAITVIFNESVTCISTFSNGTAVGYDVYSLQRLLITKILLFF